MPLSTSVSPKSSRCNGASAVLICFCRTRTLDGTLRSTFQGWKPEIPNGTINPITSRPLRERHTNPYALLYAGQDDFKHGRDLAERLKRARLRRMEQGMADFERRFEMRQKIEQGMARFEQRFAQWEARQAQAERERQPA